jgi:hypothetical protein
MTVSNESIEHQRMISTVKHALESPGWITRRDERHTDLVAILPGRPGVVAIECEMRCNAFWIRKNISRNAANGCALNVIIGASRNVTKDIRKVVAAMAPESKGRVLVVDVEDFTSTFLCNAMEGGQQT